MSPRARSLVGSGARGLALTAVLLYALNLRAPMTALAPVIGDVSADLALTPAAAGLLTGVPVLCFALATPLAAALLARVGVATMVSVSLLTILGGTVLRSVGDLTTALAGTVLIGVAITVGNVAVPMVIGRDFPGYVARATGLYTAALNAGSVLTTTLTAPLAVLVGWRWALASWGLMAVVALVVWQRVYGRHGPQSDVRRAAEVAADDARAATAAEPTPPDGATPVATPPAPGPRSALRRPVTWLLAGSFAGQAFSYYAVTAWLPSILHDTLGMDRTASGGGAALFQLAGIAGGLGVPLALGRRLPPHRLVLVITALWLTLPVGLALAPQGWVLWCLLAGVAQGGNFAVIFTIVAERAGSMSAARQMSAGVQTVGYAGGAVGPTLVGAVHEATGDWTGPLGVVVLALTLMVVCGFTAARRG